MKTWTIYFRSNFQIHNTVLITIITVLVIRSLELAHLTTGSLYPSTDITLFPPPTPPAPGNHHAPIIASV